MPKIRRSESTAAIFSIMIFRKGLAAGDLGRVVSERDGASSGGKCHAATGDL
jgi:hypothetical protein